MTYTIDRRLTKKRMRALIQKNKTKITAIIYFSVSFLLSGAILQNTSMWFGTAFVGASGAGIYGFFALLGSTTGYCILVGFEKAAIYVASAVVIYTISFVFQYSPIYKNRFFALMNVSMVLGISYSFDTVSTIRGELSHYLNLFFNIICGALMTYAYQVGINVLKTPKITISNRRCLCILICLSSVLVSCVRFQFYNGISLGNVLLFLMLLVTVYSFEDSMVCLMGGIIGFVFTISKGETMQYFFISGCYSLVCFLFNFRKKILHALLLLFSAAFYMAIHNEILNIILMEIAASIFIFMLIPQKIFVLLRFYCKLEKAQKIYVYDSEDRSDRIADLMAYISSILKIDDKKESDDTMDVFQTAVDRVCYSCSNRDICWENHDRELLNMFYELKDQAELRGVIQSTDCRGWFLDYCFNADAIIKEINYELRKKAEKNAYDQKLQEKCEIVREVMMLLSNASLNDASTSSICDEMCYLKEKQISTYLYSKKLDCDVSVSVFRENKLRIELQGDCVNTIFASNDYLEEISEIMNLRLRVMRDEVKKQTVLLYEAEPFAVSVGVATKKKRGEHVCGDFHSYFKTEQGMFYVVLSDGLGSGEHARNQSTLIVRMLERFLISGLCPNDSVQLTNMIASFHNIEQWDCATIDLFCLDLYSGEAEIYKLGASVSYHNKKNEIVSIKANSLCAGNLSFEFGNVDHSSFTMHPGEQVVLLSDGVIVGGEELRLMIKHYGDSMKNLARSILLDCQNINCSDDMTVIAVEMEQRL